MKFKLISCEIFFREMEFLLEQSPHQIDVEFLQKGLHDIPTEEMLKRIQAQVDAASEQNYDTIILGYALCNNGLVGLKARNTKLILTRAHDCITLFFGSRQKYQDYFNAHPGTYFKTTGWIERDYVSEELKPLSIPNQMGMDQTYEELVEQYGEDNAEFLWEELCDTKKTIRRSPSSKWASNPTTDSKRCLNRKLWKDTGPTKKPPATLPSSVVCLTATGITKIF